jgi:hypothetical protein
MKHSSFDEDVTNFGAFAMAPNMARSGRCVSFAALSGRIHADSERAARSIERRESDGPERTSEVLSRPSEAWRTTAPPCRRRYRRRTAGAFERRRISNSPCDPEASGNGNFRKEGFFAFSEARFLKKASALAY